MILYIADLAGSGLVANKAKQSRET